VALASIRPEGKSMLRISAKSLITRCAIQIFSISILALSASAAGPYDGTYVGIQRVSVGNNQSYCVDSDHVEVNVADSKLVAMLGTFPLSAIISSDGSFDASQAQFGTTSPVRITGKITGEKLDFDMGGRRCNVHVSASRQTTLGNASTNGTSKLSFEQCMTKCQQITNRSKEQCFDTCK
jgi:hypothetical protein